VARRALSVKPGDRFGDALELARAIDEAVPEIATPSEVAAWAESLFPAGMGMRVLRQRVVDAAIVAAKHLAGRRTTPPATPVPLPEPDAAPHVEAAPVRPVLAPAPRLGFRPAPRSAPLAQVEPRPVPRPVSLPRSPVNSREDDVFVGEFSLAAPPFPHPVRRADPVEAIEIDVVLPDPPPPLRLPVQPRVTAREELRRAASAPGQARRA
jgi:hypothetical protein